jgi:hypothetical protein
MIRRLLAFCLIFALAACGGGGGGSSTSTGGTGGTGGAGGGTTTTLTNFTTITVDGGPAGLDTGPGGYTDSNTPFVSVTLCAPGSTTNCQTIDHVILDTGSVGLRIVQSVLNASLLAAMPAESDDSGNPVGECYVYVDGYVFGSVRQADFTIGGEQVANMPVNVLGDTGAFSNVPASCSAGGGSNEGTSVQAFGANGIIGVGVTATDCGTACTTAGGYTASIYYDCPSSGCSSIIARASSASAPFQQLPNPVAAMAVDNNGTVVVLPAAPAAGEATTTGTVYFGIGTQTNNTLTASSILTTTGSSSALGAGLVTVNDNGQVLNESFIDSGSNAYYFVDSTQTLCSNSDFYGYYCPSSPESLSPSFQGQNGVTASGAFTLNNAQTYLSTGYSVLPGVGGNTNLLFGAEAYQNSFDYGLPFFYGRTLFTAIEGRSAGGTTGPYFAF